MNYVMVPVPNDLVEEVERFLAWNVTREPVAWEHDAAAEFLGHLEPEARALLLVAAEAAIEARAITCEDVARAIGVSPREVVGIAIEVNEAVRRMGGLLFLVATTLPDPAPDGSSMPRRVDMPTDAARILLQASGRGTPDPPIDQAPIEDPEP